jgi:uncharacterized membrane protein YbhN (UPF0104 family)
MTISHGQARALRVALRVGAPLVGMGCIAWLLRTIGTEAVADSARRAAPWLPLLLLIEGGRTAAELMAARHLLASKASNIPAGVWIRTHLIAYSISIVTPAGRPASEAAKATLIRRYVGLPSAAAMASSNQVLNLVGEAMLSAVACASACWYGKSTPLTIALVCHCTICLAGAVLLCLMLRSERFEGWLSRIRSLKLSAPEFRRAAREQRLLVPALWFIAGKAGQVLLLAALFRAIGAPLRPESLPLAQGLKAIASVVGDLIPAQLGSTDGVFAGGASAIGVSVSAGLSAALLLHCVQLIWVSIGALTPLLWREPNSGSVAQGCIASAAARFPKIS